MPVFKTWMEIPVLIMLFQKYGIKAPFIFGPPLRNRALEKLLSGCGYIPIGGKKQSEVARFFTTQLIHKCLKAHNLVVVFRTCLGQDSLKFSQLSNFDQSSQWVKDVQVLSSKPINVLPLQTSWDRPQPSVQKEECLGEVYIRVASPCPVSVLPKFQKDLNQI